MLVGVVETMFPVEARLSVVDYSSDCWLTFEELEYNPRWHTEVLYDHYYPIQMDRRHTERENRWRRKMSLSSVTQRRSCTIVTFPCELAKCNNEELRSSVDSFR